MGQTAADVRQGLRRLTATPLLSIGATLILAVGIGSAVVMVDILDRLLLRAPAHVTDPDRVSRVYVGVAGGSYVSRTDFASFEALAGSGDDLESHAIYLTESLSLGRGARARQVEAVAHSGGYFTVLGVRPHVGSWPGAAEDAAAISHRLWQQEFGGAEDVPGKPLRLGLDTYSIAAVAPPGFAGIDYKAADVWLPLAPRARAGYGPEWKKQFPFLQLIARLREGVSREPASDRATAAYRATHTQPWEKRNVLVLGDLRPARAPGQPVGTRVETLVAGMSILVLLITCGNVANLLLVRGLRRDREFAIKTALGASRARLLKEVLMEAALLASGAGVLAVAVVITGGTLMRREFLSPLAALATPLDGRLVFVTAVICTASAFLLGLAPAFRLTTRRALSPAPANVRPSRLIDVFSGVQVALSLPLLIAAVLFALSLWNARHQDFGMRTDHVAVVTSNLFEVGRPWETHAAHRDMQARIARLPQVESTAVIQTLPMAGGSFRMIDVPGRNLPTGPFSSDDLPLFNGVDPSFFPLMRMRLTAGRLFTDDENREGARPVAVITESMARIYWPGQPAVGKCFYMDGRDKPCTEVVGVLADARLNPSIRPTKQWASACYLPIELRPRDQSARTLLVRTVGDPARLLETIQRESQAAAPELPYVTVHLFDDVFTAMLRPWRLGTTVFVIFGALCAVIAAIGLAVVGAYGVTRRRRELGIRSALGAQPRHLIRLVLGRSLGVMAAGVIIGLALAWTGARVVSAQLFDVTARDPRVFALAALTLLLVGGVAAWLPARRAARINPTTALRAE